MKLTSIHVRAEWDDEAQVWVATSQDVDGLSIESDTLESLGPKVTAALQDLLELNGSDYAIGDIPVHIHADQVARVLNPGV
ncbi:DUF1902 domain-containing protein [Mariluticola halotolerans]|uniref:DUF1902 domain-containing protein n=1 Tax=Mariluticola halotolerans TaxID=2909283 RepID=UPI0026E1BDDF|nr:DUF1902 domain-containing protein [Mariluticola halotolerans]UJQ95739.1 DUF1902 domain-containing protein [Mariluticola halotolerans]